MVVKPASSAPFPTSERSSHWKCCMCSDGGQIEIVSVPYVFRYLVAELAAMNIRVELRTN